MGGGAETGYGKRDSVHGISRLGLCLQFTKVYLSAELCLVLLGKLRALLPYLLAGLSGRGSEIKGMKEKGIGGEMREEEREGNRRG